MILLLAERGCSRLAARVPQLLRKLSSGLLLRDLEQSASARGATEPLGERRRAAVASARLDAGMLRASKGSVADDGVSLPLVEVEHDRSGVALIPHTLAHTTLGGLQVGAAVNIETDLLAKYVLRQGATTDNVGHCGEALRSHAVGVNETND